MLLIKCLTWWKVHQIASFKDYIFKKAPTSEGAHSPHTPPCSHKCGDQGDRARFDHCWHAIFDFKNLAPPFENRYAAYDQLRCSLL